MKTTHVSTALILELHGLRTLFSDYKIVLLKSELLINYQTFHSHFSFDILINNKMPKKKLNTQLNSVKNYLGNKS